MWLDYLNFYKGEVGCATSSTQINNFNCDATRRSADWYVLLKFLARHFFFFFFYIASSYRRAYRSTVFNPKYELCIRRLFKRTAALGEGTNLIKSPRAQPSALGERARLEGMKGSYFINDGPSPYDGGRHLAAWKRRTGFSFCFLILPWLRPAVFLRNAAGWLFGVAWNSMQITAPGARDCNILRRKILPTVTIYECKTLRCLAVIKARGTRLFRRRYVDNSVSFCCHRARLSRI